MAKRAAVPEEEEIKVNGAGAPVDVPPDTDEEEDEEDGEDIDLSEIFLNIRSALDEHEGAITAQGKRIESMDRTLFSGLRGLVMLIDHLERGVNPLTEPAEKVKSLIKVRETIDQMQQRLSR
jgi:hypothetical protein